MPDLDSNTVLSETFEAPQFVATEKRSRKAVLLGILALIAFSLVLLLPYVTPTLSFQRLAWFSPSDKLEPLPQVLNAQDGTTYSAFMTNHLGAAGGSTLLIKACKHGSCYKALEIDGDIGPQMCLVNGDHLLVSSQVSGLRILFPFVSNRRTTPLKAKLVSTWGILAPPIFIATLPQKKTAAGPAPQFGPKSLGENGFSDPSKPNICGASAP
jgi:hypothetical protein